MKKIKFLTVLILAITLNFGFVVADATAKNNVENKGKVEEVKSKEEKTKDKNEKEEEAKAEEEERKEIEKNIKEHEEIEKAEIEKNKKKYENFKKEDYEVKDFNLEVFWKNGVPYLHYVHKKTKAQIVFILVEEEDFKSLKFVDGLFFRTSCNNDSGLTHFSEHCLSKFLSYFITKNKNAFYDFEATTSGMGVKFSCSSNFPENDLFFKKCYENLKDENLLEDENWFKTQKKRIIDEINKAYFQSKSDILKYSRTFNVFGEIKEIEKISLKDVKRFCKRYIHPSNMIITKYIPFNLNKNVNRKKIAGFLNNLNNLYLKKFEFKNITSSFKYKDYSKFRELKVPVKSKILSGNSNKNDEYFKYFCEVVYDLDKLNLKLEEIEGLCCTLLDIKAYERLKKFTKDLGYDIFGFSFGDFYEIYGKFWFLLQLKSNNAGLFKKDVLEKNLKKILEFIKNEIKKVKPEELQNCKNEFGYQTVPVKQQGKNVVSLSKPYYYKASYPIGQLIDLSFAKHNEPFSPKVFYKGKNNEIIDSKENILEKTKNNLNSFDVLINEGPYYIDVFKGDENVKKEKFDEYETQYLPIKIKDVVKNKWVYILADLVICNKLGYFLSFEKGYSYELVSYNSVYVGDYVGQLYLNKKNKNKVFKYLKKNFDSFIKNLKYDRSDFKKTCKEIIERDYSEKNFEKILKKQIKDLKKIKSFIKAIDEFCKTGKTNDEFFTKDSLVEDVLSFSLLSELFKNLIGLSIFKDYDEYNKLFIERYDDFVHFLSKISKNKKDKINKNILQEYRKYYLDFCYDLCKHRIKSFKENKSLIKNVKYEDVLHAIKSAYYCEDDDYKKMVEFYKKREKEFEKIKF